jgi:hypothetical protein
MFIKLRLEDSDKISKIKYSGEDFSAFLSTVGQKLGIGTSLEIYYLDEQKEKVSVCDLDDLKLAIEEAQSLSSGSGSPVSNLSLIIKPTPGQPANPAQGPQPVQTAQPVQTSVAAPRERETFAQAESSVHYPLPPAQHKVTATFVPVEPAPATEKVMFSSQINPSTSSLFGGLSGNAGGNLGRVSHDSVACDECRQSPLIGNRYKSLINEDFDLCETCSKLDKYRFHTFIQIRYYDPKEINSVYALKNFKKVLDIFRKDLTGVNADIKETCDKLQAVFTTQTRDKIEQFVRQNSGLAWEALFAAYIKKFHN